MGETQIKAKIEDGIYEAFRTAVKEKKGKYRGKKDEVVQMLLEHYSQNLYGLIDTVFHIFFQKLSTEEQKELQTNKKVKHLIEVLEEGVK